MSVFSDRLKQLREEKGKQQNRKISQDEVAKAIGIEAQSLGRYENEKRTPDIDIACRFADYYGVSVNFLLGRDNGSTPDITTVMKMTGLSEKAVKNISLSNPKYSWLAGQFNAFLENIDFVKFIVFLQNFTDDYQSHENEKSEKLKKADELDSQIEEACANGEEELLNELFVQRGELTQQIEFSIWQMERTVKLCVEQLILQAKLKAGEE